METWRRFFRLNRIERRLVLEAAAALSATWAGLRLVGFQRWKRLLERLAPAAAGRAENALQAQSFLESATVIALLQGKAERHLFFRANCLEQSLSLQWLLLRRQIPAELRIGGRKQNGRFEAHAWVEVTGHVLRSPGGDLDFVPFNGPIPSMETQVH